MPLFVIQHRHLAEYCPASTDSGALMLAHVSAGTAARYGVAIQAEALLDGQHALVLVLEAADRERVDKFMSFFARLGDVEVFPASSSEEVIRRGGCVQQPRR